MSCNSLLLLITKCTFVCTTNMMLTMINYDGMNADKTGRCAIEIIIKSLPVQKLPTLKMQFKKPQRHNDSFIWIDLYSIDRRISDGYAAPSLRCLCKTIVAVGCINYCWTLICFEIKYIFFNFPCMSHSSCCTLKLCKTEMSTLSEK